MLRSLCLASALLLLATTGWAQNNQLQQANNSAEERACRGDAHRFCRDALPDEFRVASCLQEHRDRLSHGCRAMLEGHGM
jgi:Cysteine rich repeat